MLKSRKMSESRTIQTKLVLPPDTNHLETIFGGNVLAYIDEIAAITAMKHSNRAVVTASIDKVDFVSSAKVGDVLELEAVISSTGRTSMEVYVTVHSINPLKESVRKLTTESFLTMVAMDDDNQPVPVPAIQPETGEEKALFEMGPARLAHRKERFKTKH
ncbi:acyl-CoA thioesterase [Sporosarcina ureilytica]|uniref:acyl-CoA thioesterase n=1 Tax=Sporosarcina ureilytica TaxID=298596 RepID=UPI000AC960AF|nr:acyl-CoA thioesterase [Sporosarcina ureilytica]